jgi:hypothetical protein
VRPDQRSDRPKSDSITRIRDGFENRPIRSIAKLGCFALLPSRECGGELRARGDFSSSSLASVISASAQRTLAARSESAGHLGRTGVRGANREALRDPAMSFRDAAGLIL